MDKRTDTSSLDPCVVISGVPFGGDDLSIWRIDGGRRHKSEAGPILAKVRQGTRPSPISESDTSDQGIDWRPTQLH